MKAAKYQPTILTGRTHSNYLYYLSQGDHRLFIPTKEKKEVHEGRGITLHFRGNIIAIAAGVIKSIQFFLHPSRYASSPITLIEAMITGIQVVALPSIENVTMIKNYEPSFIKTNINFLPGGKEYT